MALALAVAGCAAARAGAADIEQCGQAPSVHNAYMGPCTDKKQSTYIGHSVATDTIHDWIAREPYKRVVCGTLDHVGFFHSIDVAEYDWDLYLKPDKLYARYASDTAADHCESDESQWCISGEVTAPESFRTANPWFDWSRQTSTLVRTPVCVFGPWVSDDAHKSRPEIHPVNALWWSSRRNEGSHRNECCERHRRHEADLMKVRTLIILQDASGRFQRSEAFRTTGNGLQDALKQLETGQAFEETNERAAWIPTHEDYCIDFAERGTYHVVIANGKTIKKKLVRTARFNVQVGANNKVQEVTVEEGKVETTGRKHARGDLEFAVGDVEFGPADGDLRVRTKWRAPACDYCGQERFVVVRVCLEPAKNTPEAESSSQCVDP